MLHIYSSDESLELAKRMLDSEPDLIDHVTIQNLEKQNAYGLRILIKDESVILPLIWDNIEPPVVLEPLEFNAENLIAIVYAKLGFLEKAMELSNSADLKNYLITVATIYNGGIIKPFGEPEFDNSYFGRHNKAVLNHYTGNTNNGVNCETLYRDAIEMAPSLDYKTYSVIQLSVLLQDLGDYKAAEAVLSDFIGEFENGSVLDTAIKYELIKILNRDLKYPYDFELVDRLSNLINDCKEHYKASGNDLLLASVLLDDSEICNVQENYNDSLKSIDQAISIYTKEEMPEFRAEAFIRKGTLLFTWAQNDNPQFYKMAIDSFQEALKMFTRNSSPGIHAEIHNQLAVLYAEMPVEEKKKGMWAAFATTSFKESLEYYESNGQLYEYAILANNYANALVNFPPAKNSDNIETAIHFYQKALDIRDPENYPLERAHTLLNYLEASWRGNNINEHMEKARLDDMLRKAQEVLKLTEEDELILSAQEHIERLTNISKQVN